MKISGWIKLNMASLSLAITLCCGHSSAALASNGAGAGIFENNVEAAKFKPKIIRDIFYTDSELERIKAIIAQQQAAKPPEPKIQQVAVQTGPAPQLPQSQSQPHSSTQLEPGKIAQAADTAQVEFKVEGIIKIGNRGCAIINSSVWGGESKIMFVGKSQLGYELKGLHPEAETVEIITPSGKIIKCGLEKPEKK